MVSVEARKAWLVARLGDLNGRLAGIEAELDSHHAADWEELATEREGDEVLERMGTSGQLYHHLRELEATGWLHSPQRGVYALRPERIVALMAMLTAARQ